LRPRGGGPSLRKRKDGRLIGGEGKDARHMGMRTGSNSEGRSAAGIQMKGPKGAQGKKAKEHGDMGKTEYWSRQKHGIGGTR